MDNRNSEQRRFDFWRSEESSICPLIGENLVTRIYCTYEYTTYKKIEYVHYL